MSQFVLTSQQVAQLIETSIQARERAYAPYSKYKVGAALLGANGEVFTGCNVENVAYPACICAERTAVVKAVSEGVLNFAAIAVVTTDGGTPCGECRQVLSEFSPSLQVIVATTDGVILIDKPLAELLPAGFNAASLTQR
jgi:cytidine deaminase